MNRNHPFLCLLLGSQIALTSLNAGVVTTSPLHDDNKIVVAKDESVTFTGTSDSGGAVTTTLTIDPAGPTHEPIEESATQSVTFDAGTEGKAYTCTFTVTHKVDDVTCTDAKDFTYTVYVPKIVGIGGGSVRDDIWFFEDGLGDTIFRVECEATAQGIPSGKTFTWKIAGQSDAVKFKSNNQQEITNALDKQMIKSIGWSSSEANLTIDLEYNGSVVATSESFTARAPTEVTEQVAAATALRSGWQRLYTYTVKDKFYVSMHSAMAYEVFGSPSSWPQDPGCTWVWGGPYGPPWTIDSNSQFVDAFRAVTAAPSAEVPYTVNPGQSGANTKTMHNYQRYKVGGTGTQGVSATGFTIYQDNIQFCRGTAYR